jgi:hypothetical protein
MSEPSSAPGSEQMSAELTRIEQLKGDEQLAALRELISVIEAQAGGAEPRTGG